MIAFPNCKINIGLYITGKRADGYHNLETVFYPINITEALEIIVASDKKFSFTLSGMDAGIAENNLCVRAYRLLSEHYSIPPVKMHLHKTIPMGAGLGGGSSDGAHTLCLLNKKFKLNIDRQRLIMFASMLGSDCPFFIMNEPCYATGRGEEMVKTELDLSSYNLLLINPGIQVSTAWAFSQVQHFNTAPDLASLIKLPVEDWKNNIRNDFEEHSCRHFPEISHIIDWMYSQGAVYSSMSGTGSSVYGIFNKRLDEHPFPPNYFYKWV